MRCALSPYRDSLGTRLMHPWLLCEADGAGVWLCWIEDVADYHRHHRDLQDQHGVTDQWKLPGDPSRRLPSRTNGMLMWRMLL
jgi:hypothetical protein